MRHVGSPLRRDEQNRLQGVKTDKSLSVYQYDSNGDTLRTTERFFANNNVHLAGQILAEVLYNSLRLRIRYDHGYYDRTEREFLGFARVTERHHGNSPTRTIKRTYTRYFRNDSIHTKGLMLCEEIRNGGDSLYVVTANRYGSRTLTRDGNSSLFVTLDAATVCYYEGGTTAHIRRHSTFDYFEYNLAGDNTKVYSSVTNDWERTYTIMLP